MLEMEHEENKGEKEKLVSNELTYLLWGQSIVLESE